MRGSRTSLVLSTWVIVAASAATTDAQVGEWFSFTDFLTGLECEVVHTDDLEFVVSPDPITGVDNLVVITGNDVRLSDVEVLGNNDILYLGAPAGGLVFAEDRDGFTALWWVGLGDDVVNIDRLSLELTTTGFLPGDLEALTCDGCELWDDRTVCETPIIPDPLPPVTFDLCGNSFTMGPALTFVGLFAIGLVRGRFW